MNFSKQVERDSVKFYEKLIIIFQSYDSKIVIYCCDFFKMDPKIFQHDTCDAVFDRGAFEAILDSDR